MEQNGSETGRKSGVQKRSGERCEKKNWLEQDREVMELGTEWGAGVTETGLSDERKFCRSCSAHMLCFPTVWALGHTSWPHQWQYIASNVARPIQIQYENHNITHRHTHTYTTVLWPFFRDHRGDPVPEENFWTLWCNGRLTAGRHTNHPAGRHSIRTNQCLSLIHI